MPPHCFMRPPYPGERGWWQWEWNRQELIRFLPSIRLEPVPKPFPVSHRSAQVSSRSKVEAPMAAFSPEDLEARTTKSRRPTRKMSEQEQLLVERREQMKRLCIPPGRFSYADLTCSDCWRYMKWFALRHRWYKRPPYIESGEQA